MNMMMCFKEDFIDNDNNIIEINDIRRLEHLKKVLKVKVGKKCQVGLLNDKIGEAEVLEINSNNIQMKLDLKHNSPGKLPLTLAIALQRPNTVKKILHSAITMGVKKIIFFGCFKVEKSYWDSSVLTSESLKKEQLLALEQCVDTQEIEIEFCRYFKSFIEDVLPKFSSDVDLLLAHPSEDENLNIIDNDTQLKKEQLLIMGPEGGFSDYEVESLKELGAKQISLGKRILRTEFAFTALAGRFLR